VYPISSVVTPQTADVELTGLDASVPQKLNGWNGQLAVTNYVSGENKDLVISQEVVPNSGADFLYDPPTDFHDTTDAFAPVGGFYHMSRMPEFFTGSLGIDMSAPSWKVVAIANVTEDGQPLDNAYFGKLDLGPPWNTDNILVIGQGSQFDFAQDSDV